MAKKSAMERLKDAVGGNKGAKATEPTPTPKPVPAVDQSNAPAAAAKAPKPDGLTSGIKAAGKLGPKPVSDPLQATLESRLKAKGLKLKVEKAHHTNITIFHEREDGATAQISAQVGENLSIKDVEELERRAVVELLGQ